jgi:ornithine carbamoyltransferase
MNTSLTLRSLCSLDKLTRQDATQLLEMARTLERQASTGAPQQPLKGKHLALLCDARAHGLGDAFMAAATQAGAKVTRICPVETGMTGAQGLASTAVLLGRLYDAIDCEGMSAEFAASLAEQAGVPVYHGLAERVGRLADAQPAPPGPYLMQAVLSSTIC